MSTVVQEKKTRQPRTKKPKVVEAAIPQPIVSEPVVAPEPEPEPVPVLETEPAAAESEPTKRKTHKKKAVVYDELRTDVDEVLNTLLRDISDAKLQKNKELVTVLKAYEKNLKKVKNNAKRLEPREKRTVARSQLSGFNKPLAVVEEIAQFAGWSSGAQKSRTDVTNALCAYIDSHQLQNAANKREIIPDAKLSAILRYKSGVDPPLTYSTMQQHLKHLFVAAPEATQA